jgi:hypothetical protein
MAAESSSLILAQTGTSASASAGSTGHPTVGGDCDCNRDCQGRPCTECCPHAKPHSARGTVASVDATAKSFAVHPAKGEDVTVKVNDKTKYLPKGKTYDDVKADARVTVSYHNDGTDNWALTVKFAAEPKAKAEKPAKVTGTGIRR